MNTVQAEYRTDIARLAEDMAKRDAEAAKRDAEAAKREVQRTEREATARRWQTAIATAVILAGIGVATTIIINYLPG